MKLLALSLIVFFPTVLNAEVIVDLMSIAGKSKTEVARVLGAATPADTQNQTKHGEKLSYKEEMFEIVFVNGVADWITITDVKDIPLNPASLKLLGFKEVFKPTFENQHVIRWSNVNTIREITMAPGQDGNVWMIHILVKTKP